MVRVSQLLQELLELGSFIWWYLLREARTQHGKEAHQARAHCQGFVYATMRLHHDCNEDMVATLSSGDNHVPSAVIKKSQGVMTHPIALFRVRKQHRPKQPSQLGERDQRHWCIVAAKFPYDTRGTWISRAHHNRFQQPRGKSTTRYYTWTLSMIHELSMNRFEDS